MCLANRQGSPGCTSTSAPPSSYSEEKLNRKCQLRGNSLGRLFSLLRHTRQRSQRHAGEVWRGSTQEPWTQPLQIDLGESRGNHTETLHNLCSQYSQKWDLPSCLCAFVLIVFFRFMVLSQFLHLPLDGAGYKYTKEGRRFETWVPLASLMTSRCHPLSGHDGLRVKSQASWFLISMALL